MRQFYIGPEKLKEIRIKAGLTIEQVSDQTGLSPSSIWAFENKLTDLRLSTVRKLHKAYNTSPDFWLTDGEAK